jgi:hypothetical protein
VIRGQQLFLPSWQKTVQNSAASGTGFKAESFISGSYNTANGYGALYRNAADNNTATGFGALFNNTTGSENTALGIGASQSITGDNNICIGAFVDGVAGWRKQHPPDRQQLDHRYLHHRDLWTAGRGRSRICRFTGQTGHQPFLEALQGEHQTDG